ncbi:MAG: hypothetical protein WBI07_10945 [Mobilitalea sp.]
MERRYDIIHAIILVGILILSNLIHNDILKGMLLLAFAIVLIINTASRFITKDENKKDKVLYGVLLLLDCVLAAGAIYVIVVSIISL